MGRVSVVIAVATMSVVSLVAPMFGEAQTDKPTGAATQQESGEYVLRTTVRRVPVDIVVLDKSGNLVRGLTKEDFLVDEDKKPQNILSFDFFDGKTSFVPPRIPPLPADTYV